MSTIQANGMYDSAGNVVTFGGGGGASLLRASYETSPATAAHAIDDILYYNNKFYDVTSAIAIGDTLTVSSGSTVGNISERPGDMSYEVFGIPGGGSGGTVIADDVSYDNTTSGLSATNVQDAIDEVNSNLSDKSGKLSVNTTEVTVGTATTNVAISGWTAIGIVGMEANADPGAVINCYKYYIDVNNQLLHSAWANQTGGSVSFRILYMKA